MMSKLNESNNSFLFDEFNLLRFDVFNYNFKNNIIYYNQPSDDKDIISFSYSSIYQKNYSLLQNLNQNNLIDILDKLDDFSLLCIIILLHFYDYELNKKLKNKIINYNIKDKEKWIFSFDILNILISDEIDNDKFYKIYHSNTDIKDAFSYFKPSNPKIHIETLLLSLLFNRYFKENNNILLYSLLFTKINYNKVNINNDLDVILIQQNNNDIIINYNNNYSETFLYINYFEYTKYLNNFIFRNISDNIYEGISKIFDYQLHLEVSNDELIIKRLINNKEYRLINNLNNNKFMKKHENILLFKDINNES
jgi:hypothetical protein